MALRHWPVSGNSIWLIALGYAFNGRPNDAI